MRLYLLIIIITIQTSFIYSLSDHSLILNDKKAISIRITERKIDDYDDTGGGISLRYISKPINIAFQRWKDEYNLYVNDVSISHRFYINYNMNIICGFQYWSWETSKYWAGPHRDYYIGVNQKLNDNKNKQVEVFSYFYFDYVDTNYSNWRSLSAGIEGIYSFRNFTLSPWVGVSRQIGYDPSFEIGLSLRYNFILN